jgi:hypothetical protein
MLHRVLLTIVLLATPLFASGYKGLSVGQSVRSLPSAIDCGLVVFCEGTYDGDFFRVSNLDNKVLTIEVIYRGTALDKKTAIMRTITLASAIKRHSLQTGNTAPILAFAKSREGNVYGIVDTTNAIVYNVTGSPTDTGSIVTNVSYVNPKAPVLKGEKVPMNVSSLLLTRASQSSDSDEQKRAIAVADTGNRPGPFGFQYGMSKQDIIRLVGRASVKDEKSDMLTVTTAPKSHPVFEYYMLMISPQKGLLKIVAVGKDVASNDYGEQVK